VVLVLSHCKQILSLTVLELLLKILSVAILNYNHYRYFKRLLASVLKFKQVSNTILAADQNEPLLIGHYQ
jgi:hypothetical protein